MVIGPPSASAVQLQPMTENLLPPYTTYMLGTCEALRFDSVRLFRFDSIRKSWADSKIFESAVPAYCLS